MYVCVCNHLFHRSPSSIGISYRVFEDCRVNFAESNFTLPPESVFHSFLIHSVGTDPILPHANAIWLDSSQGNFCPNNEPFRLNPSVLLIWFFRASVVQKFATIFFKSSLKSLKFLEIPLAATFSHGLSQAHAIFVFIVPKHAKVTTMNTLKAYGRPNLQYSVSIRESDNTSGIFRLNDLLW